MNIELLSTKYKVSILTRDDAVEVFNVCVENPMYYKHCPPAASLDGVIDDMEALPPGKTHKDKYFIGFFQDEILVAVMDLIDKYPDDETAFIGFFMMNKELQGKGVATAIVSECCTYLKGEGFGRVRLGYAKGNPQSESFWIKNLFVKTGKETQMDGYVAVGMERML